MAEKLTARVEALPAAAKGLLAESGPKQRILDLHTLGLLGETPARAVAKHHDALVGEGLEPEEAYARALKDFDAGKVKYLDAAANAIKPPTLAAAPEGEGVKQKLVWLLEQGSVSQAQAGQVARALDALQRKGGAPPTDADLAAALRDAGATEAAGTAEEKPAAKESGKPRTGGKGRSGPPAPDTPPPPEPEAPERDAEGSVDVFGEPRLVTADDLYGMDVERALFEMGADEDESPPAGWLEQLLAWERENPAGPREEIVASLEARLADLALKE